ncbi:Rv1733c family protein [Streptomyces anandii]|uniref:Proline rich protein membrane protein n=1 Tax=Streptomyces anandii TaxID=285454 RepID=A0ABW6HC93_9ACTN
MARGIPRAQPPPDAPDAPDDLPRFVLWRMRRNPLRRTTDLAQAWIALGLFLAVLAAAPAAMFLVGDTAYRHYTDLAEHQRRTRQRTAAVLVHDAPRHPEPGSEEEKQTRYPVEVRFTDPTGRPRTARTDVVPALPAGSSVDVWAATDGTITGPPLTADQIRSRCMGWAIISALAVAAAGAGAYGLACLFLRRRNLAAWDTAWAGTAPRWTTPT